MKTTRPYSTAVRHMAPYEARWWLEQIQTAPTFRAVKFETEPEDMGFLAIFERRRVRVYVNHNLY